MKSEVQELALRSVRWLWVTVDSVENPLKAVTTGEPHR